MNAKIFISKRIDINSFFPDNAVFQNVFCGAYRKNNESVPDNTGINISKKQPHYSELTVQYWAWKNVKADYYGLCHYRRFLSFSKKFFPADRMNFVIEPILTKSTAQKYGLMNSENIEAIISKYDAVVNESADVKKLPVPQPHGSAVSVRDLWNKHNDFFINSADIDILLRIIKTHFSKYYESAVDYLNGMQHRGYNCYVLKKELFFELNEFQFGVMDFFEKQVDITKYPEHLQREYGYMCEIMYGIFIHHLELQQKYKINERQIVLFLETKTEKSRLKKIWLSFFSGVVYFSRHRFDWLIPEGSESRKNIIKIVNKFRFRNGR